MFIFSNYRRERKRTVEDWKAARDKWVAKGDEEGDYYRDNRDWERKHPYPVTQWGKLGGILLPIVLVLAVVGTFVTVIFSNSDTDKSEKPKTSQKPATECRGIKVGAHVQVRYGEYKDKTANVLSCNDSSFDIQLDDNQVIAYRDNGVDKTRTIPNGLKITVDTHKNLYVIQ